MTSLIPVRTPSLQLHDHVRAGEVDRHHAVLDHLHRAIGAQCVQHGSGGRRASAFTLAGSDTSIRGWCAAA